MRRLIIGVIGSGTEEHRKLAEPLGRWIAKQGFHLLTGAGGGVMTSAARGFASVRRKQGMSIGIVPGAIVGRGRYHPWPGYPNPWVEVSVFTHLPLSGSQGKDPMSRNHINVLTSDVIVALPGGKGTSSEVELAVKYKRPIVAFLGRSGSLPQVPADLTIASSLSQVRDFVTRFAIRRRS